MTRTPPDEGRPSEGVEAHPRDAIPPEDALRRHLRPGTPLSRLERTEVEIRSRCATGLGLIWLALGSVAAIAGTLTGNPGLFAFGLALTAVPLAILLWLRRTARGLHLTRIAPARVHEGSEVVVELRLENRAAWTCFFPRVCEVFPPEIHSQKDIIATDRLLPGETVAVRYVGYAILPRGIYTIGPTVLRVADPFGWFEIRRRLDARGELVVYPSLHDLDPLQSGGDAVAAVLENLTARQIGDEDELRGVREYRIGDSPRRVHWPLTARHRVPVVKEFHPVVTGDLTVFLDLARRAGAGLGRTSTVETAIRITASVAHEALALGHRVAVHPGVDPDVVVPLAGGSLQSGTILDRLVTLKCQERAPLSDWLGERLDDVPRGSSALVFITPYTFGDDRLFDELAASVARGVRIVAVLFDERTYVQVWKDAAPTVPSSRVIARLERIGVTTLPVPCASDLEAQFAVFGAEATR